MRTRYLAFTALLLLIIPMVILTSTSAAEENLTEAVISIEGSDKLYMIASDQWVADSKMAVTMNASLSSGGNGTITDYNWTLPGPLYVNNETITVDITNGTSFDVTLMVTNDTGANDTHTVFIVFDQEDPVADMTASGYNVTQWTYAEQGEVIYFNASKSTDDTLVTKYTWDWDDEDPVENLEIARTFYFPGVYNLTLTVEDAAGKTSTMFLDVIVYDTVAPVPVISLKDISGVAVASNDFHIHQDVILDASDSYDIVGEDNSSDSLDYKWRILDLADRNDPEYEMEYYQTDETIIARDLFDQPGQYEVTLWARDAFGNEGKTSIFIFVEGPDLRIESSSFDTEPSELKKGEEAMVTFTVTNLGYDWDEDIPIAIYLDDEEVARGYIVDGLEEDETKSVTINFTPEKSGTFFFIVRMDPDDNIPGSESETGVDTATVTVEGEEETMWDSARVFIGVLLIILLVVIAVIALRKSQKKKDTLREMGDEEDLDDLEELEEEEEDDQGEREEAKKEEGDGEEPLMEGEEEAEPPKKKKKDKKGKKKKK